MLIGYKRKNRLTLLNGRSNVVPLLSGAIFSLYQTIKKGYFIRGGRRGLSSIAIRHRESDRATQLRRSDLPSVADEVIEVQDGLP